MKETNQIKNRLLALFITLLVISMAISYSFETATAVDLGPVGQRCQAIKNQCSSASTTSQQKESLQTEANGKVVEVQANRRAGTCWAPQYETCGPACQACNSECKGAVLACLPTTEEQRNTMVQNSLDKSVKDVLGAVTKPLTEKAEENKEAQKNKTNTEKTEDALTKVNNRIKELEEKEKLSETEQKELNDLKAEKEKLEKEAAKTKKDTPPPEPKKKVSDWVDHLFTGLSALRAIFLANDVFRAAGGAGTCTAEKPLIGNINCKSCSADPYRICTKERCQILGTNCIPVQTNKTGEYRCEQGPCTEIGDIFISKISAHWYVDTAESNSSPKSNTSQAGTVVLNLGEIDWNTKTMLINVTTQRLAQCRYALDKAGANFSEMQDFNDNYFPETREGNPAIQQAVIQLAGEIPRNMTHTIYIKCNNACNLPHAVSYDYNQVKFKLKQKPDQLPPEIVYVDPSSNSVVREDLNVLNASFWLDETGSCRFSDKSVNYTTKYNGTGQLMVPFGIYNNENSSVINGKCVPGKCLDRNEQCSRCWLLLNLSKGYDIVNYSSPEFNETKLFRILIRCNDSQGNVMTEDSILDYNLMTAPGYNMSILKPEKLERTYNRKSEISVTSEPRATECRYKIIEYRTTGSSQAAPSCNSLTPNWSTMRAIDSAMSTTHSGEHNETLNASREGLKQLLCVKCRDTWRIEVINTTDFFTLLDDLPPVVIRMYHDLSSGDYLLVETNEESDCVYSTRNCAYNFSDGTAFMSSDNYMHAAYWQLDNSYYVKCKDKWNNYPGKSSNSSTCTQS
jgi:hypothetical protein